MTSGDGLHDVSLNFLVLEDRNSGVNKDRGRRGIKVGAKVRRWLQHVNSCDLQSNGLQLGQKVKIHKVFLQKTMFSQHPFLHCYYLTKQARPLPPAVHSGGLDDELNLRDVLARGLTGLALRVTHGHDLVLISL